MTNDLKLTALSDREIVMTRTFDAPRELVFEAWTRPDLVKRWLYGPEEWKLAVCDIDLRVGGALRFVWRHTDGRTMGMGGVYREIAPPDRLVLTALFDDERHDGETRGTLGVHQH